MRQRVRQNEAKFEAMRQTKVRQSMNNSQRVKMGFSAPTDLLGRSPTGMRKLVYKPEFDDPSLAKKKKTAKKKTTTRRKGSAGK